MEHIRHPVVWAWIDDGDIPDSGVENGTGALRLEIVDAIASGSIEALLHALVE